jgi:RHS repeat-associated protein
VDGDTYSYDAQGNVTSIVNSTLSEEITMSYKGREMVSYLYENAATMTSKSITYSYDQDGYRVSKNVDGIIHEYFLDGPRVLVETIGTTVIYYTYDDEGKLISLNLNGTEYLYQRNALGDIVGIYLTNGLLVVSYEYDAYGNIVSKVDNSGVGLATLNPYRYRGYRFDEETGLYYLNSRYLNPETGRFLCSDGYLGTPGQLLSTNMYTYALNNPNTYFDPTGYIPVLLEIAIGIFIDVAIDAAFAAITGPAVVALQFMTNILSEIISTIFINLLNAVDWALNLDKNILTAAVLGGVMIVGGVVIAKLMKKFKSIDSSIDDAFTVVGDLADVTDPVLDQTDDVIDTYKALKKTGKEVGTEVHHIIEQRFLKTNKLAVSDAGEMLSVRLSKSDHLNYTNAWRSKFPYGIDYSTLKIEKVIDAAKQIYKDAPELLNAALRTFGG